MSADVIVVGAGVIGAAIADALSADGMRVLVVDQSFPAAGVTSAGMGHVVVMDDSAAQLALTAWSRELFRELVPAMPQSCEVDVCGTLWLAEDDAQMGVARERESVLRGRGVAAELLDESAVAEAEPELRRGLAGALRVVDDAVVYPPAFCAFLLGRAVQRGARVMRNAAVRSLSSRSVTVDDTVQHADFIVNAAGVHAPQLTPGLAIVPRKGHLVVTDRYPGFCRHQLVELGYMKSAHVMSSESVAFNVQPRATGQLLIGSSRELVGFDAHVNHRIVSRMIARATSFMPRIGELHAFRTWTGFRPATADKLPLIGDTPSGVWVAAGHEGLGITTALGTARLLADLIQRRTTAIDADPFSLQRLMIEA